MIILGVDPGTATTGFGVIEWKSGKAKFISAGVISTKSEMEMPKRLLIIQKELAQLIKEYKPDEVAVELLYFAANVTTAMAVGQARGVAIVTAASAKLPVYEYTPLQVKQAITGYGRAEKAQIQQMVKTMLGLNDIPKPDDAADGLAIAITHAHNLKNQV